MEQKKIGEFIAQLRRERQLTQAELGEMLGVTNKTVSRWENGNYMPDLAIMPDLCGKLGISINELLSGEKLDDAEFRVQAENNMIKIFQHEVTIKRFKAFTDFLSGAGTGILLSTLYAPDTFKRTVIIAAGLLMICTGQYCRYRMDKKLFGLWEKRK